jgi:hypothetical protein
MSANVANKHTMIHRIQYDVIQHYDTQKNATEYDIISIVTLSVMSLSMMTIV